MYHWGVFLRGKCVWYTRCTRDINGVYLNTLNPNPLWFTYFSPSHPRWHPWLIDVLRRLVYCRFNDIYSKGAIHLIYYLCHLLAFSPTSLLFFHLGSLCTVIFILLKLIAVKKKRKKKSSSDIKDNNAIMLAEPQGKSIKTFVPGANVLQQVIFLLAPIPANQYFTVQHRDGKRSSWIYRESME